MESEQRVPQRIAHPQRRTEPGARSGTSASRPRCLADLAALGNFLEIGIVSIYRIGVPPLRGKRQIPADAEG
jgi:hypothetical protein